MKKRSFENWNTDSLATEFGVVEVDSMPILSDWLAAQPTGDNDEKKQIEKLRVHLAKRILTWKEQDIIMNFIGPLLVLVQFDSDKFSGFAARKITSKVGEWELSGLVDYMVATGKHDPGKPFFCFHEYKAERRRDSDPLGQVLAAMIAAQAINQQDQPLFGVFVNGRNWFFVVLDGKNYAFSQAYDSTQADVFQIFSILRDLKRRILERVA